MDKSASIVHIEGMNDSKSVSDDKKPRKGTVIAGVEHKQLYFIPGRGAVEATSMEEAIKKSKKAEVSDGNN